VLLVEDDPATLQALALLLRRRGWEVQVAATVAAALALVPTEPDWLVVDLMLPDGDGTRLVEQVRRLGRPTRVAVTTGSTDATRLRAVNALRPDLILIKPIQASELFAAMEADP
jgi:DNA-binding response OmpR family regulator